MIMNRPVSYQYCTNLITQHKYLVQNAFKQQPILTNNIFQMYENYINNVL
jgi:hypothetical protein